MLTKFLNSTSLSKSICDFIGYFILSVLLFKLGQRTALPIYIISLISCLFFIRALLGGYCIIKLLGNRQQGTKKTIE